MAQCGDLTGDACTQALDASDDARGVLERASSELSDLASAMRNGDELTDSQQTLVGAIEQKFGGGSATSRNVRQLSSWAGRAARAIGQRGGGITLNRGPGGSAMADEGVRSNEIRLNSGFFSSRVRNGVSQRAIIAHEIGHKALGFTDFRVDPWNTHNIPGVRGARIYGEAGTNWLGQHWNDESVGYRNPFGSSNDSFVCLVFAGECGR